jgi:hypothetical protein
VDLPANSYDYVTVQTASGLTRSMIAALSLLSVRFVTTRFTGFAESLGPDSAWPDRPVTLPSAAVAALDRSALREAVAGAAAAHYQEGYLRESRLGGPGTPAELDAARRTGGVTSVQ